VITTLSDAEQTYGLALLEHLDRTVTVPVISHAAAQGDVSILRVTTGAATIPMPAAGVPVVRGEDGGHTHLLLGADCYWTPADGTTESTLLGTLTVPDGEQALLSHPEHGALLIEPGTYRIGRQREYAGEWRLLAD